jgi:hypothetical protein
MAAEARDFSYIPMISVAGLGRGDAAATDRVVAEISAACETAGFFMSSITACRMMRLHWTPFVGPRVVEFKV